MKDESHSSNYTQEVSTTVGDSPRKGFYNHLFADLKSGSIIFVVALPLYIGIAVASGAPVFSGIISGVIGGIVVAIFGGTKIGVSGPSAGMISIMILAISALGYGQFLLVIVISGLLQILFGYLKLGMLGYYFPNSTVKGMLASIGIVLILKQFPYLIGMGGHSHWHLSFHNLDGSNTFSILFQSMDMLHPGALLIGLVTLIILWLWERPFVAKTKLHKFPVYFLILVVGIFMKMFFISFLPAFQLQGDQLVHLPSVFASGAWNEIFHFPDFGHLANPNLYRFALLLALISSLEALLVVEGTTKLDPQHRVPFLNQELIGQGVANFFTGLLGGIPITQVVVLNLANIKGGGQTRMASVFHGLILLICILLIPEVLNQIPLASLAAILLALGMQLTKPLIFRTMYRRGWSQFLPFIVTIIAILFSDILTGMVIGIVVGFFFLIKDQNKMAFLKKYDVESSTYIITLGQHVSFLNKGGLTQVLENLPPDSQLIIDLSQLITVDLDILYTIKDFRDFTAKRKNIHLEIVGASTKATGALSFFENN